MGRPAVITHRGANKYAPQNTLPAFKRAVEIGTDGFETDVHITKDGKIVLCHNYTIDETSTGKGKVADMTLEELKSYDFGSYFSNRFIGTEIPTIDEFLSFVETTDISVLNIEIKSPEKNETGIVIETIKAVKEHGLFDRLLISSFDPKLLMEAKRIDRRCKTGFLYSPTSPTTKKMFWKPVDFALSLGCDALHPHFLFVDKNYVKKAHDSGIIVNPWTVDIPEAIDRMLQCGVDGIITDLPDVVNGMSERYDD